MIEALLTLVPVVALLLGSPGPAPLALAAVSASFGIKKGIAFLCGILAGLAVAMIGAVIGLSALFSLYPSSRLVVQIIGGLYIFYVAFKIASAPVIIDSKSQNKTPTFADGFILNLLNPKAYAAFLAIFSQFSLPMQSSSTSLLATASVCMVVALLVDSAWLALGGILKPLFKKPLQARILRIVFAVLMIIAVAWTFLKSAT